MGKTFKGLTDKEFTAMTAHLQSLKIDDDGYTVTVRPEVVVEVAELRALYDKQFTSKSRLEL